MVRRKHQRDIRTSLARWRRGPHALQAVFAVPVGHRREGLTTVALSPDGKTFATGGPDGTPRLWRAATFAETDASATHGRTSR